MARSEQQECPAEGKPSGLHDVLSSAYGMDLGLDLHQQKLKNIKASKCHPILSWNLKPIIMRFHNYVIIIP